MSEPGTLYLEKKRSHDMSYQKDFEDYSKRIKQLQHILSVRAPLNTRSRLLGTTIRIINRGRAEAFAQGGLIYFDIALLDLIQRFADELSASMVKNDTLHQMEFSLLYATALNGNKELPFLNVNNTVNMNEEQKQYVWKNKLRSENVIIEYILGFIIAHEIGHLVLEHDSFVKKQFPVASSRQVQNASWIKLRRRMELEADEFASRLCLDALMQPAQLVPWLTMNEIRRRFYGTSAEYPTSAQRMSVINNVYLETIGREKLQGNLMDFVPLPPHRDVLQIDYQLYLEEFRKVRKFAQTFLLQIDKMISEILRQQVSFQETAQAIILYIEGQREFLQGAQNPMVIEQLLALATPKPKDASQLQALLEEAGMGSNALVSLQEELAADPIAWDTVLTYLNLLKAGRSTFLFGLTYEYILGNTAFRWAPNMFKALQDALPEAEIRAKALKPYDLQVPLFADRPSFTERLNVLRVWDGVYPDMP